MPHPDILYWTIDTVLLVLGVVTADLIVDWIRERMGKK